MVKPNIPETHDNDDAREELLWAANELHAQPALVFTPQGPDGRHVVVGSPVKRSIGSGREVAPRSPFVQHL